MKTLSLLDEVLYPRNGEVLHLCILSEGSVVIGADAKGTLHIVVADKATVLPPQLRQLCGYGAGNIYTLVKTHVGTVDEKVWCMTTVGVRGAFRPGITTTHFVHAILPQLHKCWGDMQAKTPVESIDLDKFVMPDGTPLLRPMTYLGVITAEYKGSRVDVGKLLWDIIP